MISCGGCTSTAKYELLLLSLRTLLLTASQHSSGVVCHALSNVSGGSFVSTFFHGNAESATSSLCVALNMSLSCLRAASVWGSATFSSLPDIIGSTDRVLDVSNHENSCGTLISLRLMLSESSPSSPEGSYFDMFMLQLRYSLHTLSQLNRNNVAIRSSLGDDEMRGMLHLNGRLKEIIVLSLSILSEWVLVPTPFIDVSNTQSVRDSQYNQLVVHQQGDAARMCQSLYIVYLVIIETWDVLLRSGGGERGILLWRHTLEEYTNGCTDSTCCSISALEGAGLTTYGTGVNDGTSDPDSFLNALIGLTVAFAERHLVRTCSVYYYCVCL